jgi:hypothetical protein
LADSIDAPPLAWLFVFVLYVCKHQQCHDLTEAYAIDDTFRVSLAVGDVESFPDISKTRM